MTVINGNIQDIGMDPLSGVLIATSVEFRTSGDVVIAPEARPFPVVAGQVSADLVAGPTRLTVKVGSHAHQDFDVVVPESGTVSLATLIDEAFEWTPQQVSRFAQLRDEAVDAAAAAAQSALDAAASEGVVSGAADDMSAQVQAAASSASQALGYRNTASGHASTASTKAGEASTSAGTATTKAGEAATSASQALGYRNTASGHASTATTKAGEASSSASDALAYRNTAQGHAATATTQAGNASTARIAAESARDAAVAAGLAWRGVWASGTQYVKQDAVSHAGSSWRALAPSTGVTPVEGVSWTILAARGETGPGGGITDASELTGQLTSLVDASGAYVSSYIDNQPVAQDLASWMQSVVYVLEQLDGKEPVAWSGTQAQYDALGAKNPNRAYYILDS